MKCMLNYPLLLNSRIGGECMCGNLSLDILVTHIPIQKKFTKKN